MDCLINISPRGVVTPQNFHARTPQCIFLLLIPLHGSFFLLCCGICLNRKFRWQMVVCGCGQWLLLFSYVIAAIAGVGARHVLAFRQQQNDIQSSNTIQYSPVVSYSLIIESKRLPGKKRMTITVNGTSPGPVMWVELGQTVEVTILNHIDPLIYSEGLSEMEKNQSSTQMGGTTIHWHGMSQQGSIYNDGVVGLTQCAIPPNQQVLYRFTPSRLGTFWYHGHFNDQYPNGK